MFEIHAPELQQIGRDRVNYFVVRIEEIDPERGRHSAASVVGRAAAEAEDDAGDRMLGNGVDDLRPNAAGRGMHRIALVRRESPQSSGLRHFKNRRGAIARVG